MLPQSYGNRCGTSSIQRFEAKEMRGNVDLSGMCTEQVDNSLITSTAYILLRLIGSLVALLVQAFAIRVSQYYVPQQDM